MNPSCSTADVLRNYNHSVPATEGDIRKAIRLMIKTNELFFLNPKDASDASLFSLSETFQLSESLNESNFKIVVSKPNMREFTAKKVGDRNHQIDTIDCFINLIQTTTTCLRICSPFFQENVLTAIPQLKMLFSNLLRNNVEIKLLTRELYTKPEKRNEIKWLVELSQNLGCRHLLKIRDYHIEDDDTNKIISGTHSKILISD